MIVVRYADDFGVGFQHIEDAEPPKRRDSSNSGALRSQIESAEETGSRRPFRSWASPTSGRRDRNGRPAYKRISARKKIVAKLADLKIKLEKRIFEGTRAVGTWLARVVTGHYRYYGVPGTATSRSTARGSENLPN